MADEKTFPGGTYTVRAANAKIEDIPPEPEPEPEPEEDSSEDGSEGLQDAEDTTDESSEQNNAIEVEGVTMTFEKPADTQLDLF